MENADYLTTHKDYSESVDALERAIATLKKQAYDRTQLLQVSQLNLIPEHAKKVRLGLVVKSYKTRRKKKIFRGSAKSNTLTRNCSFMFFL